MKTEPKISIPSNCPRFHSCSVNNCPLEPAYPNLYLDDLDPQKKCPMEKGVRTRISAMFQNALKMGGLTVREHSGKARYDALSPSVKSQMAKMGADRFKRLRQG